MFRRPHGFARHPTEAEEGDEAGKLGDSGPQIMDLVLVFGLWFSVWTLWLVGSWSIRCLVGDTSLAQPTRQDHSLANPRK